MSRLAISIALGLVLAAGCTAALPNARSPGPANSASVMQEQDRGSAALPARARLDGLDELVGLEGLDGVNERLERAPRVDVAHLVDDPIVLTLTLGGDDATQDAREIYEERYLVLCQCLNHLSPDIEGEVLVRVHIEGRSQITGVSVGWHIDSSNDQGDLPDPLEVYTDAVECIEGALLHTQVLLAAGGEQALYLEFSVR